MYNGVLLTDWFKYYIFSRSLPFPLLVVSTIVVILGASSTMTLRLGMGRMGLCSICHGRHNPKEEGRCPNERLQIKRR
jgi:hypothetical protein